MVKNITPQAGEIYQLLLTSPALSAVAIGNKLQIYPHAVYRAVKNLIELGLIEESNTYPLTYQAKSSEAALNSYINNARESFLNTFFSLQVTPSESSTKAANSGLLTNFIKNRQDLLAQSDEDMRHAKKEVTMIVSGLIASAETLLAYKRAAERGVRIRIIVQRLDETNEDMLKNWKKLGVQVRYYPLIEARILIFDETIVYITSYNPQMKEEGVGVRFHYKPIALLMQDVFEKRWEISKEIN